MALSHLCYYFFFNLFFSCEHLSLFKGGLTIRPAAEGYFGFFFFLSIFSFKLTIVFSSLINRSCPNEKSIH